MPPTFFRRVLNKLQPITHRHSERRPVSDLFPWIVKDSIDTHFQSHDIASLFSPSIINRSASCLFVIFDPLGTEILRTLINVQSLYKNPISIASLLRTSSFEFGTFSIFHSTNPECLVDSSSVLTDRGYLFFTQRYSDFRHYVHGNFDAVTLNSSGIILPVGGSSFLDRTYNFQHLFENGFTYDLFFVNPTSSYQDINILESSSCNASDLFCIDNFSLPPRGSFIYTYAPSHSCTFLAFRSKIVLCRPICFKRVGSTLDVFHA